MADARNERVSTHRFEAHDALLVSVMREQAGTLAKAIQEGVMNSIDAGATRIDIRATTTTVEIRDNGKGFASTEEILTCFKVFGLPQDVQERLGKTYGHYRMGRGQMFHYGRNVWRTNAFAMHTDLDNRGLDFDIRSGIEPSQPGCHIEIELYDRHHMLLPSELAELENEVARAVKYAPAAIVLNGRLITRDPTHEKWDMETEDAWMRLRESGTLDIYNQGVYVESRSPQELGTAGTIVSKTRLQLNFARNMVMASECAVWKRIRTKLRDATDHRIRTRKERLTEAQRDMIARRLASGEFVEGATEMHLVTDVARMDWSIKRIISHCKRHHIVQMLVAPSSDRRGDVLQQEGRAFVIHPTTLERFRCETLGEFLALLRRTKLWPEFVPLPRAGTFEDPSLKVDTDYRLLPPAKVTPLERVILDHLQLQHRWSLLNEGYGRDPVRERQIVLGESPNAEAWTDGSSYIAIERRVLHRLENLEGWIALALLLASQYCSEIDTAGAFEHGPEFYTRFHEMATTRCPGFAAHAAAQFPKRLRELERQVSKRVLKMADRTEALQRDWARVRTATDAEGAAQRRLDFATEAARDGLPAVLADPTEPDEPLN
jgi:hypothetical protein